MSGSLPHDDLTAFDPAGPSAEVPANSLITRRLLLGGSAVAAASLFFGRREVAEAATKRTTTRKKATKTTAKTTVKSATTKAPTTVAGAGTGSGAGAFAGDHEVAISYTYAASGGGRIHNPYVAVWVEDADGVPVRIVHFEYQLGKGRRWIDEMKRWARVDEIMVALGKESTADTTTSSTRVPGSYSVVWDGKDADGQFVKLGTYAIYVEAAREKGPYQFVKTMVNLTAATGTTKGTAEGELTAVSIAVKAK
jgi:hypothetical protein